MNRPDFVTLPELPGHPDRRLVNGSWIDREEYDVCHWHIVRTYTTDEGGTGVYWAATLDGLRRYGQLVHQRRESAIAAARTRREADDEFADYVDSLHDAKPNYPATTGGDAA